MLPQIGIVFPPAHFHALAKFIAPRRAVFGNARLTQDAIDPQPIWTHGGRAEISWIAAPRIVAELVSGFEEIGARGIEMNVIANGAQVAVAAAVDNEGFIAAAEQVAKVLVAVVEARGVGAEKPFHAVDKVGARRFNDEMKVIAH